MKYLLGVDVNIDIKIGLKIDVGADR